MQGNIIVHTQKEGKEGVDTLLEDIKDMGNQDKVEIESELILIISPLSVKN